MVDSIQGPGKRIIITTKPKAKESVEKKGSFDDAFKDKTESTASSGHARVGNPAQNNLKILQQQQLLHMQRLQEISKQVQDGTYKMVDPAILAEKIYQVISDRPTREKFIKKILQEEAEKVPAKDRGKLTDLELKKLVFMIKETQDEPFEDPELEELLKTLA
jgi:anti-sigma28 factor (negative regulator of flagellin synthesis)